TVLGIDAGILDRCGVLEGFEDLTDVQSDLVSLRLDTVRELKVIGAVAEPNAGGDGELLELALQPLRVILGCDVRIQLLLLESRFAARDNLAADHLDVLIERLVRGGAQPRAGESLLQRVGAADVSQN